MSEKQTLLRAIEALPETANWTEITDALLDVAARHGSPADYARLYRTQLTPEHLAEYLSPKTEVSLASTLAELEARDSEKGRP